MFLQHFLDQTFQDFLRKKELLFMICAKYYPYSVVEFSFIKDYPIQELHWLWLSDTLIIYTAWVIRTATISIAVRAY